MPVLKKIYSQLPTLFLALSLCVGALFAGLWLSLKTAPVVNFSVLQQYAPGKPSILLDCHGKQWGQFEIEKRIPVTMDGISNHIVKAFVAAEDWKFFEHNGISLKGIVRSAIANITQGRVVQGASTITQQLVKLLFFDNKKTFKRKIKEQFLALLVEQQFTKDHILELYVNHVYFGTGLYGIEAAAQRFWGVSVNAVSIAQAALLAAVVCSPGHYSPLLYPLSAQQRRNIVLGKMHKLGFITDQQYAQACAEPLRLVPQKHDQIGLYAKETIRTQLEEKIGKKALYTQGLTIQTTLDTDLQKQADQQAAIHFERIRQAYGGDIQGALISLDTKTGAIRALVGGVDFKASPFNRALQARRQQGSVFKPLLYTAALLNGRSLADRAVDEPLVVEQAGKKWEPRNYNRMFEGPMTLARALSYSNNIISVKILLDVGAQKLVDLARACRLTGPIHPYPSLALGCVDSTLVEVAAMFNVFAHDGIYTQPYLIAWVKDVHGKKSIKHTPVEEKIIPVRVAHQMAATMMCGLERRKKQAVSWIDSQAIGKTGTTNDSRTCWFVGSTPELTTAVYIGCDDNRPLGKYVFPAQTAYPLWLAFHKKVPTTQKQFLFDPSLQPLLINGVTGEPTSLQDPQAVSLLV